MHPPTRSMETKDPNFEALGQKNFLLLLKKGDFVTQRTEWSQKIEIGSILSHSWGWSTELQL